MHEHDRTWHKLVRCWVNMSELCQLCHCEVSQETRNPGTPEGVAYDWCKVRAIKHCEDTARSCKNSSIVQTKQHMWLIATKKWALNLSLSLQHECMAAYFGVVASYRRTVLRTTLLKLWAYELHASSFQFLCIFMTQWHNDMTFSAQWAAHRCRIWVFPLQCQGWVLRLVPRWSVKFRKKPSHRSNVTEVRERLCTYLWQDDGTSWWYGRMLRDFRSLMVWYEVVEDRLVDRRDGYTTYIHDIRLWQTTRIILYTLHTWWDKWQVTGRSLVFVTLTQVASDLTSAIVLAGVRHEAGTEGSGRWMKTYCFGGGRTGTQLGCCKATIASKEYEDKVSSDGIETRWDKYVKLRHARKQTPLMALDRSVSLQGNYCSLRWWPQTKIQMVWVQGMTC